MSFSTYLESALLNHVFRNTPLTSPASIRIALFTAAPTDAGGGTEVSGSGYARQTVAFSAPIADPENAARRAVLNSGSIQFETTHTPILSIVAVGYFDALTAGNLIDWTPITAVDLGVGAAIRFPVNSLKVFLS